MENIKEYYKESWRIMKKNRKIIIFITLLFFLSLISGVLYYNYNYENHFSSEEELNEFQEFYKTIIFKDTLSKNFIFIFLHNIRASLFRILTGIFFAIIPILSIINEFFAGYPIIADITNNGLSYFLLHWLHYSILEVFAMILSSSLGVSIFLSIFRSGKKIENISKAYKESIIVFLFVIIPLLFIAAIIESLIIMIRWF